MKSSKINLVTAWQWLEKELEERDLSSTQQLTLFHLFIKINRNFWKPARLSINKLAVAMSKDKRTVSKALEKLIELGLVIQTEGGYYIGIDERYSESTAQRTKTAGRNVDKGNGIVEFESSVAELDPELAKQFG